MSPSNQTPPIKEQTREQIEQELLKTQSMLEQLMPREDWLKTPPALEIGDDAPLLYDWFESSLNEMIQFQTKQLSTI